MSIWVSVLGLIASIIWYCFSANDRYLVKVYRNHVEEAHNILRDMIEKCTKQHLSADYDMSISSNTTVTPNLLGWRCKKIGLTDYATMVPIAMLLFWISYIASNFIFA